jgi:hypothetical protein
MGLSLLLSNGVNMLEIDSVLVPPKYCKYASGECDQRFDNIKISSAFFIYPSQPVHLANTIKECVSTHQKEAGSSRWLTWEDLSVGGKIIFCEICKAIRGSRLIVANITDMNFNVLFELGYAIGLRKPVLPVRDSTYETSKKQFDEIGIFDTLGYEQFTNSINLGEIIKKNETTETIFIRPELDRRQPIFFMKSPIDNDGSVKLFSILKKSWFKFRTFDSRETPRLSLHDAYKQTLSSIAVVGHLIDPNRTGAIVHNARVAFVCGMALAAGKHVLMFQEGILPQPIDYRDIIIPYTDVNIIPYYMRTIFQETTETLQSFEEIRIPLSTGLLERIDLGDAAAENEITALSTYFVKTPQFQQARQGHARIVIGRKGAGKTALFYGIRNQFSRKGKRVIVDLKPEGHQFIRLRETVLAKLSEGLQLHTLTAFWHYLLLLEITNKVLEKERSTAYQYPHLYTKFAQLESLYEEQLNAKGDFSERLMALVNRLVEHFPDKTAESINTADITNAIYHRDIERLNRQLLEHLQDYDGIWILFDNIDKGFPTHGLQKPDILIIRCLLEASRKLQASMGSRNIECITTIFIRKDVYDHLIDMTPDRGKETNVNLDWSDIELVKELLLKRFRYHVPELNGSFEEVWGRLFNPNVSGESSFEYMLSRTFLRPRDILNFVRKCIQVAASRGHTRVQEEDIFTAEVQFSVDMLDEIRYEIRDVYPDIPDFALSFLNVSEPISTDELYLRLMDAGIPEDQVEEVKNILLWFSFLGVHSGGTDSYAYEMFYNVSKLEAHHKSKNRSEILYTIHPAFMRALTV